MPRVARSDILARFHAMKARGEPIIGAGAGTGISAKGEEQGGADLIVIYNSGRYRMAGRGSLAGMMPYGDANAVVVEMAARGASRGGAHAGSRRRLRHRPVPADGRVSRRGRRLGFSGVQNFPTVGLIDGRFRAGLEETGMGYAREVEMIAKAHDRDLLTTPYVFDPAEAVAMARAGADVLVCHFGLHGRRHHRRRDIDPARRLSGPDRCDGGGGACDQEATSSFWSTADRSPNRPTPTMCWRAPTIATASTAPRRWSACRSSARCRSGRKIQDDPKNCEPKRRTRPAADQGRRAGRE